MFSPQFRFVVLSRVIIILHLICGNSYFLLECLKTVSVDGINPLESCACILFTLMYNDLSMQQHADTRFI